MYLKSRRKPKTIVAIGGGEIGRPGYPVETTAIDREIVRLSGKQHPRLLFVPTASNDAPVYVETVNTHFGERLGCRIDTLYLATQTPSREEIAQKISNTDIIYVGGGNTLKMLRRWEKLGVDNLLKRAYDRGVIVAGLSAGSICWFRYGNSDSRRFRSPDADLIRIRGLGLINALNCPHYNDDVSRQPSLKRMMARTPGVAIAVDHCAALVIHDATYRVIASKPDANAYKTYWKRGQYHEELLQKSAPPKPLEQLLAK